MKRKLFSAALSTFALLLLMGAADVQAPVSALLAEEESAILANMALEAEARPLNAILPNVMAAISSTDLLTAGTVQTGGINWPAGVKISEGEAVPAEAEGSAGSLATEPDVPEVGRRDVKGQTYVSLSAFAQVIDPVAAVTWDGQAMIVTAGGTSVSAANGQRYMVANGRYLYVPHGAQVFDGELYVPEEMASKAFSGLVPGDSYYDQNDLFWLSRVIYRESGNQSLEGQMAVGNVILNRVADPAFPNTVESVLAQKNQFSTYRSGALRHTSPSDTSVIAAKLVLDGGVVEATRGATFFDSGVNSWASRNKQFIAAIEDHNFYG